MDLLMTFGFLAVLLILLATAVLVWWSWRRIEAPPRGKGARDSAGRVGLDDGQV